MINVFGACREGNMGKTHSFLLSNSAAVVVGTVIILNVGVVAAGSCLSKENVVQPKPWY